MECWGGSDGSPREAQSSGYGNFTFVLLRTGLKCNLSKQCPANSEARSGVTQFPECSWYLVVTEMTEEVSVP